MDNQSNLIYIFVLVLVTELNNVELCIAILGETWVYLTSKYYALTKLNKLE